MSDADLVILAVLAAWFVVNVVAQVRKLRFLEGVISNWRLFAPDPVRVDFDLFYRDGDDDGNWSAWRRVDQQRAPCTQAIINPGNLLSDALEGIRQTVQQAATLERPTRRVHVRRLLLVNIAAGLPPACAAPATMRQVAFIRTAGRLHRDKPTVCYVSPRIRLERA